MSWKETYNTIKFDISKLGTYENQTVNFLKIVKAYLGSKGAQAVILYRLSYYFGRKSHIIGTLIANRSVRITGCEIRHAAKIGKGLRIVNTVGIVISDNAVIGENCMLYQGATVGRKIGVVHNYIGNNVQILAGAKVITERVGNDVIIGANAVVTKDVPDNCVVAGVNKIIGATESKAY